MDGSSTLQSQRWKQFCAGALGAASLLAGHLVFGQDASQLPSSRRTAKTAATAAAPIVSASKAKSDEDNLPPIIDARRSPRPTALKTAVTADTKASSDKTAAPLPVIDATSIPAKPVPSASTASSGVAPIVERTVLPSPKAVSNSTVGSPSRLPLVIEGSPAASTPSGESTASPNTSATRPMTADKPANGSAPQWVINKQVEQPSPSNNTTDSVSPWMVDIREAIAETKTTETKPAAESPAASGIAYPVTELGQPRAEVAAAEKAATTKADAVAKMPSETKPSPDVAKATSNPYLPRFGSTGDQSSAVATFSPKREAPAAEPAAATKSTAKPQIAESTSKYLAPKPSTQIPVETQPGADLASLAPPTFQSLAPAKPAPTAPKLDAPSTSPQAVPHDNSYTATGAEESPQEGTDALPPVVSKPKSPSAMAATAYPAMNASSPAAEMDAKVEVVPATGHGVTGGTKLVEYQTPDQMFIPPRSARKVDAPVVPAPRTPRAATQMEFTQAEAPRPLPGNPAGPFELIGESGSVSVMVRRSLLLRTKTDIYRTAVVDPAICDVLQFTPREISIIGKSQGSTHVTFWFDDPNSQPITYLVKVEPDAAEVKKEEDKYKLLEDVVNEMFPDSKIQLTLVADKLIVKGQAKDSEEATQIMSIIRSNAGGGGVAGAWGPGGWNGGVGGGLSEGMAADVLSDSATGNANRGRYQVINMLRVPGVQQVALRVKIAELNRTAARGFGVDVHGNVSFSDSPEGTDLFFNSILNLASGGAPALLAQFDGDDISVGIRYLQQQGVIRLLSEPTLVTMSGRPATFVAGGEFAVPTVVGSAGLNAVTTDFRAFGAIISFLPTVVDKDRIRLEVAPEFSQINQQIAVNGTPGLKTRSVTTTVEMREGQTLAIAGLLEDNMNGNTIGDLPFLARVFGRRSMTRAETELIILVTPELMQAMEPEEVPPLPGFDVTEPDNAQFFLHGSIEGNPTREYRSTVWPRLKHRYKAGGPAMTSGPFGHGQ